MKEVKRTYQLGEEWLYFKIYCGVRTADRILANEISELTQKLLSEELIDKWFFIRYADPEKHIRLRFELTNPSKLFEVVSAFNTKLKPLMEKELVWKVQTETYNRELERYGPFTMELSETLFFRQSQLIIQLLQEQIDEEAYFVRVLKLVNEFVSNFYLNDDAKIRFLENNYHNYISEFVLDKNAKLDIKKKYHKLKQSIDIELADEGLPIPQTFLKETKEIMTLNTKRTLEVPIDDFITSHVHMLVNRAFRNKQRIYEMLVYKFLHMTEIKFYFKIK